MAAVAAGLLLGLLLLLPSDAWKPSGPFLPRRRGARLTATEIAARLGGRHLEEPARDFTLTALNGRRYRLSDLRGQVVVINFWATWCGPCMFEMGALAQLYGEHRAAGLEILAVSIDEEEAAIHWFLQEGNLPVPDRRLPFPVLHDRSEVRAVYQVGPIPDTLVVDRAGIVRYRNVGFGPTTANELEAIIGELLAPATAAAR